VGNFRPIIFHKSIETTLALKKSQKLELEHKDKLLAFEFMPVVEFIYIDMNGRNITKIRKTEKN
jgi:hypothetical protein